MGTSPLVIAFGGGTDSTAMLIEMERRGVRPDLIQFADTGNRDAEKPKHTATSTSSTAGARSGGNSESR